LRSSSRNSSGTHIIVSHVIVGPAVFTYIVVIVGGGHIYRSSSRRTHIVVGVGGHIYRKRTYI
jgi:hypothetical protein